jgi:hypothetical protein
MSSNDVPVAPVFEIVGSLQHSFAPGHKPPMQLPVFPSARHRCVEQAQLNAELIVLLISVVAFSG